VLQHHGHQQIFNISLFLHGLPRYRISVHLMKKRVDVLQLFIQMLVERLVQFIFLQFPPRTGFAGQGIIELPFMVEFATGERFKRFDLDR